MDEVSPQFTSFGLSGGLLECPDQRSCCPCPINFEIFRLNVKRVNTDTPVSLPLSSVNIFIWSVALCAHAACKSFGGLFAVRFILGICEGAITAGFLIVTSMFYTRAEQTLRVGYWCEFFPSVWFRFKMYAHDTV